MNRDDNDSEPADARAVIDFWFSEHGRKHWFSSSSEFDSEITARFGSIHETATRDGLEDWLHSARGALALIIVLDQFTRNIYRGSSKAYMNDGRARKAAHRAIELGYDKAVESWHRAFLYMPFMHSEALPDQDYSVALFTAAGLDNARYAIHHREIIRRFGRFPHRNSILGRNSTHEERLWLASDEAFHG